MLTRPTLAALLAAVLAVPAAAQPPDPAAALQGLTGARATEIDQAVRGVCAYPAATRAAILDLAASSQQHPKLLADLARLRKAAAAEIDRYLTSGTYDATVQQAAARVLVEAPETIDRMQERPELVRVVGVAWSTPPGRQLITAVLDAAAARQETQRTAAADQWAGRLAADPALMQQYAQLLEEYTRRTADAGQAQDATWKAYGYGTYKTDSGYVVTDVPSQEVINYALAVGYRYTGVVDALIQQYLTGNNGDEYQNAVGGWFAAYGGSIPDSARDQNAAYYGLLQDLGRYADSGAASAAAGNAADYLRNNAQNYPRLADWASKHPPRDAKDLGKVPKLNDANPTKGPGERNSASGPPPFGGERPPFGPPGAPSGAPPGAGRGSPSPFADRLRATPPDARARAIPQGAQNPFSGNVPKVGATPRPAGGQPQLFRGSPPVGQQLSRAQGQLNAAWAPRVGGPRPGPGGPRRP